MLTGSSARKLRRGGTDLLGGRALVRDLHPFMGAELTDLDLDRALRYGMVPLVLASADPADTLSAYASLYLEQEVRVEGLVRDVGQFARFLEAISFSHDFIPTTISKKLRGSASSNRASGSAGTRRRFLRHLLPARPGLSAPESEQPFLAPSAGDV